MWTRLQNLLAQHAGRGRPETYRLAHDPALVPPLALMRQDGTDVLEEWFRWGEAWSVLLRVYGRLCRDSRVLEIGCGLGRTAFALRHVLMPEEQPSTEGSLFDVLRRLPRGAQPGGGRYDGFDVCRERVAFLDRTFHQAYPHFRFIWADIHNPHHNPRGRLPAADYHFPYPAEHFDVVFAVSAFTHLRPEAAANYLHQAARVLKRGGRCLFSFYLLDHHTPGRPRLHGPGRPAFNFDHRHAGYGGDFAVGVPGDPEELAAYRLGLVERLAAEAGLRLAMPAVPGLWSGQGAYGVSAQDLILLAKP